MDVCISIYNPRKFVAILNSLTEYGINVKSVDSCSNPFYGIMIVDNEGLRYARGLGLSSYGLVLNVDEVDVDEVVVKTIIYSRISSFSNSLNRMIIGIDYGERIGVAIVVGSDVVYVKSFKSESMVYNIIEMFAKYLSEMDSKIIRIGLPRNISKKYSKFVETIVSIAKNHGLHVEFVSEAKTSQQKLYLDDNAKLDRDSIAAINIALMRSYT